MKTDVVVIGGGLAGLTCAVALSDNGAAVTLIEGASELGGRARSWSDAGSGDVIDIGPHVLLTEYRNMFRLLDRLGTRDRITWHTRQLMTLIDGGTPVSLPTLRLPPPLHFVPSLVKLARAPSLSAKDVLSNMPVAWLALKIDERDVERLDGLSAQDFLRAHGVTPRFIDWFWATTAMSIMNVPLHRCSAGSLMRFYRIMIGGDLHIGFATHGLSELYVPQALQAIVASDGQVLRGKPVKRIAADETGAVSAVVLADETRIDARYVVSAIPAHQLPDLLPSTLRYDPPFNDLADFEPSPYVSVYLWFEQKLTREQFWVGLWSEHRLNYDFYDLSNIRAGWTDRPSVIASNIIYSHRAHRMSDAAIIEATRREVAEYLPAAAHAPLRHAVVNRIPMAIPCPYPGVEHKRPGPHTPLRNFFLAGDWTRTGLPSSMESAVRSGWLAAEVVSAAWGRPRGYAAPPPAPRGFAAIVSRLSSYSHELT